MRDTSGRQWRPITYQLNENEIAPGNFDRRNEIAFTVFALEKDSIKSLLDAGGRIVEDRRLDIPYLTIAMPLTMIDSIPDVRSARPHGGASHYRTEDGRGNYLDIRGAL